MSIAVMNWVWANSPTSGNERLVLLALADACSRDDGTGCWPSAATIARKANISARTVRRVITRLEGEGHVVVHRGGGRAGSTNSYRIRTGVHSPGQSVTPDTLSGGDSGDSVPVTEPYQGTPDRAVSPDPPRNYQRTIAPPACSERTGELSAGPVMVDVGEFFEQLAAPSPRWLLTAGQRRRLTSAVASALAAGWTPGVLAALVGANAAGIRNPAAVLAARLATGELPPTPAPRRPPWCGECDPVTRMLGFDGDAPRRCLRCKPPPAVRELKPRARSDPAAAGVGLSGAGHVRPSNDAVSVGAYDWAGLGEGARHRG